MTSAIFSNIIMAFIITLNLGLLLKSQHVSSSVVGGVSKDNLHLTHVFKEGAKKQPSVVSLSRAEYAAIHEVIFAISQSNVEELIKVLEDVSDPSSGNYGKHWSKSQVTELTANKQGYDTVKNYLNSNANIAIKKETLNGEYIFATAPVHVWEDVFATTFHVYEVPLDGPKGKQSKQIIRAEEYSLPLELAGHVSTVLNTVQFHGQNNIQKRYRSDVSKQRKDSSEDNVLKDTDTVKLDTSSEVEASQSAPSGSLNHDSILATTLDFNTQLHVPYYLASNTASATQNIVPYSFTVCSAGYIYIADCDPTRCLNTLNDQYIRLYADGYLVAYSDQYCNSCSGINYYTYSSYCRTYTLYAGCYSSYTCSGNFTITLRSSSTGYTSPTRQPSSVYSVGSVTPRLINQFYSVSSNVGNFLVSQAVYETNNEGYSLTDLKKFQQTFDLPEQTPKNFNSFPGMHDCSSSSASCYEGNLDVQYIMGIAQNVNTIYDYELLDTYDFLMNWIISVSNTATPANVYSISWGIEEIYLSAAYADLFNMEAIKLGVMGTTILAASGDDGAVTREVRADFSYCGYVPLFPASSPYVVSVGGTNVSLTCLQSSDIS